MTSKAPTHRPDAHSTDAALRELSVIYEYIQDELDRGHPIGGWKVLDSLRRVTNLLTFTMNKEEEAVPMTTESEKSAVTPACLKQAASAERTLLSLGYVYCGGDTWEPPKDGLPNRMDRERMDNLTVDMEHVVGELESLSADICKFLNERRGCA